MAQSRRACVPATCTLLYEGPETQGAATQVCKGTHASTRRRGKSLRLAGNKLLWAQCCLQSQASPGGHRAHQLCRHAPDGPECSPDSWTCPLTGTSSHRPSAHGHSHSSGRLSPHTSCTRHLNPFAAPAPAEGLVAGRPASALSPHQPTARPGEASLNNPRLLSSPHLQGLRSAHSNTQGTSAGDLTRAGQRSPAGRSLPGGGCPGAQ